MPSVGLPGRTRKGNKDRHPALDVGHKKELWAPRPAEPPTRRTSEQVTADAKKADEAKRREEKEQRKLTSRVADIEDNMRNRDKRREAVANHPPDVAPPKTPGPVPVAPARDETPEDPEDDERERQDKRDPGLESGKRYLYMQAQSDDVPESRDESEYEHRSDSGEESSDDDMEEEETTRGRGRKKVVKPRRKDVVDERKTKAQSGTPAVHGASAKRKESPTKLKYVTAKKSKNSKKSGLAPARKGVSPEALDSDGDDRMVKLGGPAIDDDPNERVELKSKKKHGKPVESDSIKITALPKPKTNKERRDGRPKWGAEDLPAGMAPQFKDDVTPLVRELMGFQHDPWEPFADEQVAGILDMVYGPGKYDLKDPVWHSLISYRLSDWRGSFGHQANKGLQLLIDSAMAEPDDDSDDEPDLPQGLFEADLIVYTFAAHLTAISSIPSKYVSPEDPNPPIGAMILSIQAVERALRAWSTGKLVLGKKTSDHFSKDNWGDTIKHVNGNRIKDKRATKYVPTLLAFKNSQWARIYEAASEYVEKKKKTGSSRSSSMDASMADIQSDEDDDFVLMADVNGELVSLTYVANQAHISVDDTV
ncbi:hypothetical protein C8J57DRAFT_1079295 [Mycena rebaudengoi]|nr:hypothetical protein C8J57DRAFT_1079295 [Mycena rebaudengoi]